MEPDDADDGLFRQPPAPDDRLWRHPSELGAPATPGRRGRHSWFLAAASGLTGAVLAIGVFAAVALLDGGNEPRQLVVRKAAQPAAADGDDVVRVVHAAAPSIVRLEVATGAMAGRVGSGIVFRDDGHVLTNAHVVEGAHAITAVLDDGRSVGARVVGADAASDVAVVRLEAGGPFRTAMLGTIEGVAEGDRAIAMGAPAERGIGPSVATGTVAGLGREVPPALVDMIETDADVTAGQSGGALLDRRGVVIGLVTASAFERDGSGQGGFAVPVDVARAVAEDLVHHGHVRRVWMGVRGETRARAVHLVGVLHGSPAQLAGLAVGDVLRRVDGRSVASMIEVRVALRRRHPGDRVVVVYDRDGTRRTAVLALAERPAS